MVDNNATAVQNALQAGGIQLALPQRLEPVTTKENQVQKVVYDPEKLAAVKAALGIQRPAMSRWEAVANALAQTPEARSFTGGFGEEIINPWASGLSTFARSFGNTYGALKADERTKAEQAREDAIKAAQMEMEASKQNVTDKVTDSQMKVNDPNAKTLEQLQQAQIQEEAALDALRVLDELAKSKEIRSGNKETSDWWLSEKSSKNIGRRDQALSSLIPLTNKVARASGGSGINTVGEMMAYLGIPENATSAQIAGALPGMIKKLGMTEKFYQMTPTANTQNQPIAVGGYQIIPE